MPVDTFGLMRGKRRTSAGCDGFEADSVYSPADRQFMRSATQAVVSISTASMMLLLVERLYSRGGPYFEIPRTVFDRSAAPRRRFQSGRAPVPFALAALTIGAAILFYLHGPEDPTSWWVRASASRVLLTPLLMLLMAAAAANSERAS